MKGNRNSLACLGRFDFQEARYQIDVVPFEVSNVPEARFREDGDEYGYGPVASLRGVDERAHLFEGEDVAFALLVVLESLDAHAWVGWNVCLAASPLEGGGEDLY